METNPRLYQWRDWRKVLYPLLGKSESAIAALSSGSESPTSSLIRGRATSDALLAGYQIPKMDMPPMGRPIGMLKLKRETSNTSDHSAGRGGSHSGAPSLGGGRTSAEIQRGADMLLSKMEPLSPEAFATIVSGSMSLLNDNDDQDVMSDTASITSDEVQGKIRELNVQAEKRQQEHRKEVDASERKMALDSDVQDSEGLQLFRGAYDFWNRTMGSGKK